MTLLFILLVVVMVLAGAPLFAVIMAAAMTGFHAAEIDLSVVAIELYRIVDTPLLVALPLFTFSGYVLSAARTSQRLVDLVQALVGGMPAGLALVGFVACALFTALTGASGVTIVAIGALLLPALMSQGYGEKFSLGLVTSSGSLGLLIFPSVPLILYGVIAQQMDVGVPFAIVDLFKAGILPVLLMLSLLIAYTLWKYRGGGLQRQPFSMVELKRALWAARYELPLPLVVLGGVFSGLFAISEAAAVTAVYVTIAEVLLYRDVPLKALPQLIIDSMVMVGGILLILGVALGFTNYLIDVQIPQQLFDFMQGYVESPLMFLLLLNVLLLVLGAILDIFAAIVIMVPLLLPVAVGYGINPVHLGIIFLANMQIGYFTPPIGMNLFIASYRFRKSMVELYSACGPYFLVLLVAVLLITYVPWLSMVFVQ
ncbi:MAG: TRAP transporter large permease subunit [Gammaproteobacteria bacterium]|nr:TRAP transporter large permease subunit [Gammaproteobacteria bacterium]